MTGGVTERTRLDAAGYPKLLNRSVSHCATHAGRVGRGETRNPEGSPVHVVVSPQTQATDSAADQLHHAACKCGSRTRHERDEGTSYAAILQPFEAAVTAAAAGRARSDAAWGVTGLAATLVLFLLVAESVGSIRFDAGPWWAFAFALSALVGPAVTVYWRQLGAWAAAVVRRPRRGLRRDRRVVVDRRR